jgi:hypothetical protein
MRVPFHSFLWQPVIVNHRQILRLITIMSSPPSTPSSELPSDRSQWRFHPITTPTEWIEEYRPTWFHPIHFGDVFKDGRYKVIRKLGYGAFSTVWLATDEQ